MYSSNYKNMKDNLVRAQGCIDYSDVTFMSTYHTDFILTRRASSCWYWILNMIDFVVQEIIVLTF